MTTHAATPDATTATTPTSDVHTGVLRVLGRRGDVPLAWDKNDPASVAVAERQFKNLREEQHYHAFRIDRAGHAQGTEITMFDPDAEEIMMFAQMQGGSAGGC